jgi:hypothetical protein
VSSTLTDPYLPVAFWTGVGALALTLLLGAQIVWLRIGLRRQQRHEGRVIRKWRPLLNVALAGEPPAALPVLFVDEQILFLKLWIHLHESVSGAASDALNDIGYRLQCDAIARRLLERGKRAQKLLALRALGHLRDFQAWPELMRQAASADSVASVNALWALMQIDAAAAVESMMTAMIARDDWPLPQVVNILREAPDACAPALEAALPATDPEHLPRALQLAEALRIALPSSLLVRLLAHPSLEVTIAALRLAVSPDLLETVRALAVHEDWRVRVQTAKSLGRIGDYGDLERLRALLHDSQWWVRYRAAQALIASPFMDAAELGRIYRGLSDRYAADMLQQVMAEKGIG